MNHVLKNQPSTHTVVFTDDDGEGNALTAVPTYAAVDASGTAVQSGTASETATVTGGYEFVLTAASADTPKVLTITWTGALDELAQTQVTHAEVVGDYLFTIAEARAFERAAITATKASTAEIKVARAEITEFLTKAIGASPVERAFREVHDGDGKDYLWLWTSEVNTIKTLTIDGTSITVDDDVVRWDAGRLYYSGAFPVGRQTVVVTLEAGFVPTPLQLKRASLVLLKSMVIGSDLMDRAITSTDEAGNIFRLATADPYRDKPTGIPYVDSIINTYRGLDWTVA